MRVESVRIYPVKAMAPILVASADVELAGLRHDRRWAVVDAEGTRLNATSHNTLLRVVATPDDDGLKLTVEGREPLAVPVPLGGHRIRVDVSRVPTMVDAGDSAADWLSNYLDEHVRLAWQDDPTLRPISDKHGGLGGEPLNLADAGPVLLATTASLAQLDAWIAEDDKPEPMVMERFRPNIVIDGDIEPFAEDAWRSIRIGDVPYRFAEHCDRCAVTMIDPLSLEHGKEPIRTLARRRKWDGKTWFGIRIVPLSTGTVAVGDECVTPR